MKDLPLTQEFLLCNLNEKGELPTLGTYCVPALTAAATMELIQAGVALLEGKKLRIAAPLPPALSSLQTAYHYVEKKQSVSLENIVNEFSFAFSNKAAGGLFADVKQALADSGCLTERVVKPLLGGEKTLLTPDQACVDAVIQKIRAELLEEGEVTESTIMLTALLDKTKGIKTYFSQYESNMLKQRMKALRKDPAYKTAVQMVEAFEAVLIAVIVAST